VSREIQVGIDGLPAAPLGRPIQVVLFCGPALEAGPVRFAERLADHPAVELLAVFCETPGLDFVTRVRDLVRRRGAMAPAIVLAESMRACGRWLLHPRRALRGRSGRTRLLRHLETVRSLHDPEVLDRIRTLDPDLALSYGGPILREELFALARFGTFGIHHGRFPDYRGKKATLRALLNEEPLAGVTIQRIGRGIDDGPVVASGEVPARGRSRAAVERDLEELGLDLYLEAVLAAGEGRARARDARGDPGPLFREPRPRELAGYALRRLRIFGSTRSRRAPTVGNRDGRTVDPGVLLLTESFHPQVGGGETQARALAASLRDAGVPVRIVTRRWDPAWPELELVDGLPVHRVGPTGRGHLRKWGLVRSTRPLLARFAANHPFVVVNGFRVLGIPALLARRGRNLRVILKADSPGELSGAFFDGGLARIGLSHRSLPVRPFVALRNRLLRQADAFVAISSPIREELVSHGAAPFRVLQIPNGVDTARFRPPEPGEREALRPRFGLPPDATVAVFTGRLVRYKGLPLLLEVWRELAPSLPGAHLVLAGEGSADLDACEDELRVAADAGGGIPRLHFTGAIEAVPELLRTADLFVFPSEHEAFGISVIEAMATGLPVVATRAGGLADLVEESQGALPVHAGDRASLAGALERLFTDPDLRARLGAAGRTAALERYSLDQVRDAWLELVRETDDV